MSAMPRTPEEARDLLASLRNSLEDVKARMDAFSRWKDVTADRLDELEAENDQLRDRLAALEARIEIVENGTPGGKEAKVRAIVQYASNLRTSDQKMVICNPKEIKGTTGVSRRYAYDLVDDLPEEYHFFLDRQEARNRQYGSLEIDADKQGKGLVVDFEALHSDPEAVNKFTTTREGEGD